MFQNSLDINLKFYNWSTTEENSVLTADFCAYDLDVILYQYMLYPQKIGRIQSRPFNGLIIWTKSISDCIVSVIELYWFM